MKKAAFVFFHRLTGADFYEISKPRDPNATGGRQSYIDFAGGSIPLPTLKRGFFQGNKFSNGWKIKVRSLGLGDYSQLVEISPRKADGKVRNICVRAQKIHSKAGNRINAWHPEYSLFPDLPKGAHNAGDRRIGRLINDLVLYIIRTDTGKFWAGFFRIKNRKSDWVVDSQIERMFNEREGCIPLSPAIEFDQDVAGWPFVGLSGKKPKRKAPMAKKQASKLHRHLTQEEATEKLFHDDMTGAGSARVSLKNQLVLKRNQKVVRVLKSLYGECQITGNKFTFLKPDGLPYLEAHHLIPLGEGGADAPANLIVVSAHMHRMLHYADVSKIDLSQIKGDKLKITINGKEHTITWHPDHAKLVQGAGRT